MAKLIILVKVSTITYRGVIMIIATIKMKITREKHPDILNMLGSIAERTKNKTGCSSCSVCVDTKDDSIIFEEVWKSENDLQYHLRSDDYKYILLIMEMAIEPPDVRFNTISMTTGVETIIRARRFFKKAGECY